MNRALIYWISYVCLCVLAIPAAAQKIPATTEATAPTTQPARASMLLHLAERIASTAQWMDDGFLYDRPPEWGMDNEKAAAMWSQLRKPSVDILPVQELEQFPFDVEPAALEPGPWSADDIRPLLHHSDPKVRTLGIILLYQLNRIDVLPDLADLVYDDAETFDEPCLLAGGNVVSQSQKQPVGTFAKLAIRAYCPASQVGLADRLKEPPGISAEELKKRLTAFAKKRDRTLCIPALEVAMQRAAQNTFPIPDDRLDRIEALAAMLQSIDAPRRFYVGMTIGFGALAGHRCIDAFLSSWASELPHDARFAPFTDPGADDDPDLKYAPAAEYFADHAIDLFRISDTDFFLKHARTGDNAAFSSIIAARLRPAEADSILIDAFTPAHTEIDDVETRNKIALAMADIGGDASVTKVVDWCFDAGLDAIIRHDDCGRLWADNDLFLEAIHRRNPARARAITERIIRDERLSRLDIESTRLLLQAAGRYLGRDLATREELYGAEAPAHVHVWQGLLRNTVDEWSK